MRSGLENKNIHKPLRTLRRNHSLTSRIRQYRTSCSAAEAFKDSAGIPELLAPTWAAKI